MSLHCLGLLGPIELVQTLQQLLCVVGDFEEPLSKIFSDNGVTASFATAVYYLLVGKHGIAVGTPVDRRLFAVSQALFVQLQEYPLRPLVVLGQASYHLVVPIETTADGFELSFHRFDIFEGAVLWVNARLDSVVFGWQTKGVEAHWLEYLVALHS